MTTPNPTPNPTLKPRQKAPPLELQTTAGASWRLADQRPPRFTMLVFYRGLHCPVCKTTLRELDGKLEEFRKRETEAIAISSDTRERAVEAVKQWKIEHLDVAYGLTLAQAQDWRLFISHAIKDSEPAQFTEPALALVGADGALFAISIQSMPFARPSLDDVLGALDYVIEHNYPARGEA